VDIANGLIDKWAQDAASDLGEKSWREVEANCMMLIVYAAQKAEGRQRAHRITRPFWYMLGIITPGVLWYIISGVIGL